MGWSDVEQYMGNDVRFVTIVAEVLNSFDGMVP